ncbi:MAG TPA: right-handed parallel beta-helix repeat-containing protein [Polyangiales bacterium]|nr:right-handed parallel beta-helix repeat-containing protein [Polyangiales bacterium]
MFVLAVMVASCAEPEPTEEPPEPGGRTFYLRADGDDQASGTDEQHAWRSLARVNRQVLRPADSVLLEAGAAFSGTLQLDAADGGDPSAPVLVGSFGTGRARIEAGSADGVVIEDVSGLIIERLEIRGGWQADEQAGNVGEGVSVRSQQRRDHLVLRELEVSGFKLAGIGLHARPDDERKDRGYRDVEISDCELHDNGDFGLISDGPYVHDKAGYSHRELRVRRVVSHHNRGLSRKGEHTGSGIVLSDVDGALIEHSIAHHNGELNDHKSGGGYGIWAWDANDVVIQFNEAYENQTRTSDGGGFDLDGGATNSVIQYNYSHDNQGAGYGAFQFQWARRFFGNRIQYNISQGDGFGFLVWDGNGDMGSLAALHNVTYGDKPGLTTYSAVSDVTFVNNIFFGTGPLLFDVDDGDGLELKANDYWTGDRPLQIRWGGETFSDFEAFRKASGVTGAFTDPGLVAPGTAATLDDTTRLQTLTMYQLREDSPLIDHGLDPAELGIEAPSHDFFAAPAPRGGGPDVGVHERR